MGDVGSRNRGGDWMSLRDIDLGLMTDQQTTARFLGGGEA